MSFKRLLAVSVLVVVSLASSAFAGSARAFNPALRQVLQQMPVDGKATLRNVSLGRESLDTLELEPMEVWAKDAKIIVFGAGGKETIIHPPAVKYFKGRVVGDDDSLVFFSMSADGTIRGMVLVGDRRFTLGTGVRRHEKVRTEAVREDGEAPVLIKEVDEIDDVNDPNDSWDCEVGKDSPNTIPRLTGMIPRAESKVTPNAGLVSGATYQLRIAIETDDEFCTAFGNNSTTLNTYIGDLIAKASIVYSRDVKTTLVLGDVHLRTGGAGTDPWIASGSTSAALAEFGLYWHNNYSLGYPANNGGTAGGGITVARSSAVFLSGKGLNGGIAWIDTLCSTDFFCGAGGASCGSATYAGSYAGGYAFNGSLMSSGVTTTVPDPEATVNGVQYGLPTTSNFWMLLEMLHELGHNVASPHPNCVALSPSEQALYGVARSWVDLCLSGDFFGSACYSGTTSAPAEKGTIMSYCHNFSSGGFRQSRYLFGKAGEPNEKMLPIFRLGASLDTGAPTGLEGCTPNPTITPGQSEPVACSAGKTASVVACSGCTYAWQISGGTITSATNTTSITYTPNQSTVTLTVTIITSRGCGITASRSVTSLCAGLLPPANVVATATSTTSIDVTWTAAAGATSYNVYRSTDGTNYSLAGNDTASPFTDGGRTANTAYMYKVRSMTTGESADSNKDLATTVVFTDEPPMVGATLIKAVHISQLRTAVNAVRALTPLGAGSYTDPSLVVGTTLVKAVHINDLRTALDAARAHANIGLPAISYGETITATTTTIKTSHITELRNGVK